MNKRPFSLTSDLEFLFLSDEHSRVFEEIVSAVQRRDGLICVTGAPGLGKTMLCRRLLEDLDGNYKVVLVNTPPKTPRDMTETLDDAFGDMEGDTRIPVVVFDEAQHLDFRCLDHVKFLTNLEKDGEKLLQIVLVGQPELADKVGNKRFVQLEQRIGAKLKLDSLKKKEILPYLGHRLSAAGLADAVYFTKGSARYLYRETSGVPRLINRIANIAVEQAVKEEKGRIGVGRLKRAAAKVSASRDDWSEIAKAPSRSRRLPLLFVVLLLGVAALFYLNPEWRSLLSTDLLFEKREGLPSQFAVRAGNFIERGQADELRRKLQESDLPAAVVTKDLGEGWALYQVRLPGPYSQAEAKTIMERLQKMGIQGVERVALKP